MNFYDDPYQSLVRRTLACYTVGRNGR